MKICGFYKGSADKKCALLSAGALFVSLNLSLLFVLFDDQFCYLHCVEGCSFSYLVSCDPQCDGIIFGDISSNASHVDVVGALRVEGHGVFGVLCVVNECASWCLCYGVSDVVDVELFCCLYPYCFAVASQCADADACGRAAHIGVEYLARLMIHFHLLFGVVVVGEDVNLWYDVVSQLVWKSLYVWLFSLCDVGILLFHLFHGQCSGSACALIAGNVYALYVRQSLYRHECCDHHYGGAVWVGNNVAWVLQRIARVAFGHYERHVVAHAESTGVVYHDGSVSCDVIGIFSAHSGTGRSENDVCVAEEVAVLQAFYYDGIVAEGVCLSCTAF